MTTFHTRGRGQEPARNPAYRGPCFISERKEQGIDLYAVMMAERKARLANQIVEKAA